MDPLTWVAASPDGSLLGIGSESGRFTVWSVRGRRIVHTFETGDFVVRARWTPDGKRLLVATFDGPLLIRSGDGREALGQIEMTHHRLRDLAVHPAGSAWATCGEDIAVRIWDPETLQLKFELKDGGTSCNAVGFLKGYIVAGFNDGYSVAWTEDGKEKVDSGVVTRPPVYSLGVPPSGDKVVFGGGKGGMQSLTVGPPKKWKPGSTPWSTTPPKPIAVNAIDFASDGKFVAAFSDDQARVFDSISDSSGLGLGSAFYLRTPKPEWIKDFIVSGACFIPGTDLIATSHFDGQLRIWKNSLLEEAIRLSAPSGDWVEFPGGEIELGLTPGELEVLVQLNIQHNQRFLEDDPDLFRWGSDRGRYREKGGNAEYLRAVLAAACPLRKVAVRPFRLARRPVTVAEYEKFCLDTGRKFQPPLHAKPDFFMHEVPFDGAQAYAAWAKLRLPTAAEWEWAARGSSRRLFPWGSDWSSGADFFMHSGSFTSGWVPGSKPGLASPEGLLDLATGHGEWCADGALMGSASGRLLPNAVDRGATPDARDAKFRLAAGL
jgi:formylglycine-generating enzyme required for sulfatase activity